MRGMKKRILYGGFEREEYLRYRDRILANDIRNLGIYQIVAGIGFLLLGLTSLFTGGFTTTNVGIYLYTAAAFLITWALMRISIRRNGISAPINSAFIYLFIAILYTESITLTTLHRTMPSVTYIGVLLVLPLLFARSPLYMSCLQGIFVALFCVCVRSNKPPEIAEIDIWNGITFLAVSIVAIATVIPIRIRQMIQHEIVIRLYETDLLTGLRNRNSYELDCKKIETAEKKPICVYADANGLHELNNRYGHEAGDRLLLAAADVMREAFGERYSYRIGGDEFVAFVFDCDETQCRERIARITGTLAEKGYHMSFGVFAPESEDERLDEIIKRAEKLMYAAKEEYYRTSGRDRRGTRQ